MNAKINKQKRIDEDMTVSELAVMINSSFTFVNNQINNLTDRMDKFEVSVNNRFDKVDQKFDEIDKRFDKIDKKFDIIDKNMTNPYEFDSLVLRVGKIEEKIA